MRYLNQKRAGFLYRMMEEDCQHGMKRKQTDEYCTKRVTAQQEQQRKDKEELMHHPDCHDQQRPSGSLSMQRREDSHQRVQIEVLCMQERQKPLLS